MGIKKQANIGQCKYLSRFRKGVKKIGHVISQWLKQRSTFDRSDQIRSVIINTTRIPNFREEFYWEILIASEKKEFEDKIIIGPDGNKAMELHEKAIELAKSNATPKEIYETISRECQEYSVLNILWHMYISWYRGKI